MTNKIDNSDRTNVIMAKSLLKPVDEYKSIKGYPTRSMAIHELVEYGLKYYKIKEQITENHINNIILNS